MANPVNAWVDNGNSESDPTFSGYSGATVGNTLLFFLSIAGSGTTPDVNNLDARANTVHASGNAFGSGGGGWSFESLVNLTSGETTATITIDTSGNSVDWEMWIVEVENHPTSGGAIQFSTDATWGTGTSHTVNADNLTPTNSGSLAVMGLQVIDMGSTGSWATDPTDDNSYSDASGSPKEGTTNVNLHSCLMYKENVSTEGDVDATISYGGDNKRKNSGVFILEIDAGGGDPERWTQHPSGIVTPKPHPLQLVA